MMIGPTDPPLGDEYRPRHEERFPEKLAWSLYAVIIASTVLLSRTVVHESRWWAVFIVTVSALPALFVTSITAWTTLNEALPAPLRRVIAALSAGSLAYAAHRFGISTILICVGAFSVGLLVAAYPVHLVIDGWRSRGGRFDHLREPLTAARVHVLYATAAAP
ncbi:hypothetical protein [Micromonospora sp. CPCC 205561]|uniref:hypothetical protein n=1 Tax=Micromonospora sp. CPCC 205561 TaxID=3122407 RepID=UPI002FF3B3BA